MDIDIPNQVGKLLENYNPKAPDITADGLRELWLKF